MKFNELGQVAQDYNIGGSKGEWLRLEAGDNKVRILSEYEVLAKHWGSNKKSTVCVGKDHGCTFCKDKADIEAELAKETDKIKIEALKKRIAATKPSVKFLLWVIDRKDNKPKIAELGWTIINAIGELQKDEEYGFQELPEYDVNIKKTVKGSGTQPSDIEYTLVPSRINKPLTPEELTQLKSLTPVADVVKTIKERALREYSEMGIEAEHSVEEAFPESEVPAPGV